MLLFISECRVVLKESEMTKLDETNRRLREQLQSAMDDVGEKTSELETVIIESAVDNTHTHTVVLLLFWNLSRTTRVSRYQKGKTRKVKNQSGFTGARDSEWQRHLLGYMQVCTSSQTTTPTSHPSVFYRLDALPAAQPTASKH